MKVNVLGAGPAGLYAGLLLKQSHPGWEIGISERNPRGATYGWGVVFSDRTLTELREADPTTYREITDTFVLWDAIDVRFKDELIRCEGHTFAGIARRHLLDILERRCLALGVPVHLEYIVDDPETLRDADLLIAADGVNSATRLAHADAFRPQTEQGTTRFIWFGTDKVYDAFTFIFRETDYGLFQVHAYPFDATTSTFIVECARRRGSARASPRPTRRRASPSARRCSRIISDGASVALESLALADVPDAQVRAAGRTRTSSSSATRRTRRTSRSAPGRSWRWRTLSRSRTLSSKAGRLADGAPALRARAQAARRGDPARGGGESALLRECRAATATSRRRRSPSIC